ncbi:hypothetical protein WG66_006523 [Moniliophthora roreri]|uniref:Uncharacterized protein n=1 Tax=Moniliophthora roreri TaxID=221103 RepID=A0A0W0FT77_MONRR|nr:hypothetical protein WG66_006523 [Moniliophthora roreri]
MPTSNGTIVCLDGRNIKATFLGSGHESEIEYTFNGTVEITCTDTTTLQKIPIKPFEPAEVAIIYQRLPLALPDLLEFGEGYPKVQLPAPTKEAMMFTGTYGPTHIDLKFTDDGVRITGALALARDKMDEGIEIQEAVIKEICGRGVWTVVDELEQE